VTANHRTVVVGASLAGLRVAEGLRQRGYDGEILLIGDEVHPPYDRPPLSKQVLIGAWEAEKAYLRTADELTEKRIAHRHSTRATGLELAGAGGAVRCADGTEERYDELVIATGARARTAPGWQLPGVQTLRTLEDVTALTSALAGRPRVAVVGGGFIGAEVASAARTQDLEVTLLEVLPAPLSRVLGQYVGEVCQRLYERNGVRVLAGITVQRMEVGADGRVRGVRLGDGTVVDSDLVVVGIGAVPNTDWLVESGLEVDNGVVCDASGGAADHVWAVGDVARWHHPVFGEQIRVEHWTHATEQANHVARLLAGERPGPLSAVPYVWSDQFGTKIQIAGRPSAEATFVVASGEPDEARFVALYVDEARVVGAVSFDNPRAIARARALIAARATPAAALAALAEG
jgi:3-phenylpropionate/trans-cinnamate dioxygenase ferredoxin reductase subunit